MKALCVCAVLLMAASTLSAKQYSYNNSGGAVSQTSTTMTISASTVGSPAGTVSMSCNVTPIMTGYGFTAEWSCTGGTFSLQSTDGSTTLTGTFTSGVFTETETEINRVFHYNYALYANFSS